MVFCHVVLAVCQPYLTFRYNISYIDPPLVRGIRGNITRSDDIISSGNISPNPPSGKSIKTINDNYYIFKFILVRDWSKRVG